MSTNDFDDITPEQIKELLKSSGYLFEQRVASVIEKLGYATHTNKAFLDDDEGKSREIDVLAMKAFAITDSPAHVSCYLNCECKNSTTPFVFITRNKGIVDKNYIPDGLYFYPKEYHERLDEKRVRVTNPFKKLDLYRHHFATKENYKVVQISKIVRNQKKVEAQHSGVMESFIYPLIKSQKAWVKDYVENKRTFSQFFFSLVIVNSPLYTIDSEIEDALPLKVNFVPFVRDVQTKNIKGNHLITFVQFDYLQDFITEEIEGFCNQAIKIFEANPDLLLPPPLNIL